MEQLFEGVKEGIYVETIKHGSGLSTFTLAPSRAYMIRNGVKSEPVSISVISGSVFETLQEIDGISDTIELCSFVSGGCGKIEQYPLSVCFGGPHIRVRSLKVQ
jgi:TldD protein